MSENEKTKKEIQDANVKLVATIASIALSAVGVGFVALAIFAGVTLNLEKKDLRSLRQQVETKLEKQVERVNIALQKVERKPNVIALSRMGEPLNGKTIKADLIRKNSKMLRFTIILKNEGSAPSDPLFLKFYTKKPLKLGTALRTSSDEEHYDYESITDANNPKAFSASVTKVLPAKASITYPIQGEVSGIDVNKKIYPLLLKVYSGSENPHKSEFYIEIE